MTDKREDILARLLEVAATVNGVQTAFRNKDEISETARPAIVILDADEVADDADPMNRPRNAPRRVGMTPEIYILLGAKPESVGAAINAIRAALIKEVLTDAQLSSIVGTNGDIRYEGCATSLGRGRTMEAEMGVSFTFTYVLRPDDL